MSPLNIHILPVYSAYHPTECLNGMRLLQHQVETRDAFNDPETDVIINTAMTGDGKSLGAYLPAFEDFEGKQDVHVIAMYPTNELIRDQYYALQRYQHDLQLQLPQYDTMYSERITQLMRVHDEEQRAAEVKHLLNRNGILLTNPDLIHLIMSYQYGWGYQSKDLAITSGGNFDYFLFDEFHVFDVPQIVSVMNMLGYLKAHYSHKLYERKKYLFLSATPHPLLTQLLAQSGLRTKLITGQYTDSDQQGTYRRILQPCEISLHATGQEQTSEAWIEEHLEELLTFFRQHPESKAAILVYSPATARRLVQRLKAFFEPHGITVGENTGLTSTEDRRAALQKHILVGTSTVDVGIDFHINYLIFEAYSAGSFLQRFGRLGRHTGFDAYQAHALVPRFILERLEVALAGQDTMQRERFNESVREAFPSEQTFARYQTIWGPIQAAHTLETLKAQGKPNHDENTAFREALTQQYERMYGGTPEKPKMLRASKNYQRLQHYQPEVLKELLSFRGQSPLNCGVWDCTDPRHPNGTFFTYDLFFLLANTSFEVIEQDEFLNEIRKRPIEERNFRQKFCYLKIHAYVPERVTLQLNLNEVLTTDAARLRLHQLLIQSGLTVEQLPAADMDRINKALARQRLVCVISPIKPQELKRQLQLSGVFPLYHLQDKHGSTFSIAFGQDALLLQTILQFRSPGKAASIMA
jgi:CRISPR-associated helicase Cas3, subtype CYANO